MNQSKFRITNSERFEAEKQLKALAAIEDERKAALCDLFYELEQAEQHTKKPTGRYKKYERTYDGVVQVIKKSPKSLAIVSSYGEMMGRLAVNEDVSSRINLFDDLILKMGFRDGQWRAITLLGIGSRLSPEIDPNLN